LTFGAVLDSQGDIFGKRAGMKDQDAEVLITLGVSAVRRGFALCVIVFLGFLLIYIAFFRPPAHIGWQAFLILLGALVLVLADALRRSTRLELRLSREALTDSSGRELCRVADIEAVERGVFAFKPSNGFSLRLATRADRLWAPGIYWRVGRRLGVGGVTSAGEAKSMAEIIAALLAERG